MEKSILARRKAQQLAREGHVSEAAEEMRRLLGEADADPYDHVYYGDLLIRLGRADEAVTAWKEAARSYEMAGLNRNAIAVCKKILRTDAHRVDVHRSLGDLFCRDGLMGEAVPHYLTWLDSVDGRRGFPPDFLETLDRAATVVGLQVEAVLRLSDHYLRAGQKDRAGRLLNDLADKVEQAGSGDMARDLRDKAKAAEGRVAVADAAVLPEPLAAEDGDTSGLGVTTHVESPEGEDDGLFSELVAAPAIAPPLVAHDDAQPISSPLLEPTLEAPVFQVEHDPMVLPLSDTLPAGDAFESPQGTPDRFLDEASTREGQDAGAEPLAERAAGDAARSPRTEEPAPRDAFVIEHETRPPEEPEPERAEIQPAGLSAAETSAALTPPAQAPSAQAPATEVSTAQTSTPESPTTEPAASDGDAAGERVWDLDADGVDAAAADAAVGWPSEQTGDSEGAAPPVAAAPAADPYPALPAEPPVEWEGGGAPEPDGGLSVGPSAWDGTEDVAQNAGRSGLLERAEVAFDAGDWNDARALYERVAHDQPLEPVILARLVEIYRQLNDPASEVRSLTLLGDAWIEAGVYEEALDAFLRVLHLDPESATARRRLTRFREMGIAGSERIPEETRSSLQGVLETGGATLSVRDGRSGIASDEWVDLGALLEEFREGLKKQIAGDDYQSHYDLAVSHQGMGLYEEALDEVDLVLQCKTVPSELSWQARELRGTCLMELHRVREAVHEFRTALEQPIGDGERRRSLLYHLGVALEAAEEWREAAGIYDQVLEDSPGFLDAAARRDTCRSRADEGEPQARAA